MIWHAVRCALVWGDIQPDEEIDYTIEKVTNAVNQLREMSTHLEK